MNQSQQTVLSMDLSKDFQDYFSEEIKDDNENDEFITDLEEFQDYLFEKFDNANNETNNLRRELAETKSALFNLQIKYDKKNRENKWIINNLLKENIETKQKLFERIKKISFEVEMALALQYLSPPKLKRQTNCDFQQHCNTPDDDTNANTNTNANASTCVDVDEDYQTPKSTYKRRLFTSEEDEPYIPFIRDNYITTKMDEFYIDSYQTPTQTYNKRLFTDYADDNDEKPLPPPFPMEINDEYNEDNQDTQDNYNVDPVDPDEGGVEIDFFDESDLTILEEFNRNKKYYINENKI